VVFCEVKSKGGVGLGDPLEMVGPEKQRRLRQAAETWLAANPEHAEATIRLDVAAVRADRLDVARQAFDF
jgi:putative endonuclease